MAALTSLVRARAETLLARERLGSARIEHVLLDDGAFTVAYDASRCSCCRKIRPLTIAPETLVDKARRGAAPAAA